jgi:hypothetical protein
MATSVALGRALDLAYEGKTLKEILNAPPSALEGLIERHRATSSSAVAFRYRIHKHCALDITDDYDP